MLSGDYLMVPQRHTAELAKELPNLDLVQGYLVRKDADANLPLPARAQNTLPGVTYASMRVSVQPVEASLTGKSAGSESTCSDSSKSTSKKSSKGGSKKD